MVWHANLWICKTVKTVFVNVFLVKNENSANRGHFAVSWNWRQNLMNRSSAVLLLIPTKSENLDNLSIWYGMPISQSVRPWKPFFLMFICWRMKIRQTRPILPLTGSNVLCTSNAIRYLRTPSDVSSLMLCRGRNSGRLPAKAGMRKNLDISGRLSCYVMIEGLVA